MIMIIWFALSIPIVAAPILYFGFKHLIAWWELILPVVLCLIFIALMKWGVETSLTSDIEYWTGYIIQANYQERWTEEWDEYIPEQGHYESSGSGKNSTSRYVVDVPAHWEHRIVHHPDEFWMEDNNGITRYISREYYHQLTRLWNNKNHKNVIHFRQTSVGDGGINWTNWDQKRDTMVVLTTAHHYENRIQASHSVFKFPKIEDKTDLFDYPNLEDETNVPSILGIPEDDPANRFLCTRNAELGRDKQIRMWILVYNNKPLQTAIDQESLWMGGNKNELVVCVGTNDKQEIKWCYVFSWTENERLKIDVRQFVTGQKKLDLMAVAKYMSNESAKQFTRKPFKDFSYLTVDPPTWSIWTTYIVTLLITVGCSIWAVCNQFDADDPYGDSCC
jgi:hypothetical protein